jgi:hypothetical protein
MMSDICKVSDGTRVVGKCLRIFGYLALDCIWKWRNISQTVHGFFVFYGFFLYARNIYNFLK